MVITAGDEIAKQRKCARKHGTCETAREQSAIAGEDLLKQFSNNSLWRLHMFLRSFFLFLFFIYKDWDNDAIRAGTETNPKEYLPR